MVAPPIKKNISVEYIREIYSYWNKLQIKLHNRYN